MNDIFVFIYLVCFVALFGATFAFMWRSMGSVLSDMDKMDKPVKRIVTRMVHPELDSGHEYDDDKLMKSLDARIQELEEEDDEDDGDGDIHAKPYVGSGI